MEQIDDSALREAKEQAEIYNHSLIPGASTQDAYSQEGLLAASADYDSQLNLAGNGIMGYVEIPKISVNLPIYHGTENDSLERGIGHLLGSSLPVGGENTHTILSGHSGMASQKMFTDLEQLTTGDVFYLRVLNETLAYQVVEINTVLPYDASLLGIAPGEDLCTLVTCTPYGVNTHRLLVRGSRIPYEEAELLVEETAEEEPAIGGGNNALSRNSMSHVWTDGKGVRYDKPNCTRIELPWTKVVKYYDALMESGRFAPPEELEQPVVNETTSSEQPSPVQEESEPAVWEYNEIKSAHPEDIVLYQVGDFFEIYGEDAKNAAPVLDLHLGTRPIPTGGRVDMCGIPAHQLEEATQKLRNRFDVTIAVVGEDGQRNSYSMGKLNTEPPRREITQSDIDEALQKWNGSIDSKRSVVRYMESHARERDTAAWLAREYGADPARPLRITVTGVDGETVLPWAKVQRRIAQLIKAEKFYTEEEYDRLDDVNPVAIREQLAEHGIVNGEVVDADKLNAAPIVRQAEADTQRISDEEFARDHLIPGESTFEIDGRTFLVDRVNLEFGSVNFQDITFANSTGFPIFRTEPISFVRRHIEEQERQPVQPEMSTETVAVYPGEKTNLPYDVVVQTLRTEKPEEILNHAYEYTIREDILLSLEYHDLSDAQADALMKSPSPLADVFQDFEKRETDHMETIWDCLESRADTILEEQRRTLRETPVYPYPASYAQEHGELEQYRASNRANIACKEAIEAAIREHYHDNQLDNQAAAQVVKTFGLDRTLFVLANTVQQKDWDARFSPGNKEWAKSIPIQKNPDAWGTDRNCQFVVNSHSGLTDLFLSTVRQEYCQKQEKARKPSVRAKLQATPKTTSPKHSAKLITQER